MPLNIGGLAFQTLGTGWCACVCVCFALWNVIHKTHFAQISYQQKNGSKNAFNHLRTYCSSAGL